MHPLADILKYMLVKPIEKYMLEHVQMLKLELGISEGCYYKEY